MDIFDSFDNAYGGQTYTHNGNTYESRENTYGGEDVYKNGSLEAYSSKDPLGVESVYDSNGNLIASSHDNEYGGENVIASDGTLYGNINHSLDGDSFTNNNGFSVVSTNDDGNFTSIMVYEDPLSHSNEYVLPTLVL